MKRFIQVGVGGLLLLFDAEFVYMLWWEWTHERGSATTTHAHQLRAMGISSSIALFVGALGLLMLYWGARRKNPG